MKQSSKNNNTLVHGRRVLTPKIKNKWRYVAIEFSKDI